jgi:hypothetical protein
MKRQAFEAGAGGFGRPQARVISERYGEARHTDEGGRKAVVPPLDSA